MSKFSFVVACEGFADRATGTEIADRVLQSVIEWLQGIALDDIREWRGLVPGEPFLAWKRLPTLARERGIRAHGLFGGEPGVADAVATRRALLLIEHSAGAHDAVVLLRDLDNDPDRRRGLAQALAERPWPVPVLMGIASAKREAWVLNGFDARNAAETARLEEMRQELGFDPVSHAERLDAAEHGAKRDAKRVLAVLCDGDAERERSCWQDTDLNVLADRGLGSGLAKYVRDIREKLVPVVAGTAAAKLE
jgi:hypothetical protein